MVAATPNDAANRAPFQVRVGERPPEPVVGVCGDAAAERRQVSFDEGPDEVEPPLETRLVVSGQEATREAAAYPESIADRVTPVGRARRRVSVGRQFAEPQG